MDGTPVHEIDGKLGDFLSQLNNSYTYSYETPIRCDQCSGVIHPEKPCYILFADRYIGEDESVTSFRLTRIECEECNPPKLFFAAPGYTEFLLAGRFTTEYTITDLHLAAKSGRSSGLDWDPVELRAVLDPENRTLENMSPSDMMRMITMHFDPREIIDPETGELLIEDYEKETFQLLFALSALRKTHTKDQLKALKQSMDGDLSEEEIREYRNYLKSEMEDFLRDAVV